MDRLGIDSKSQEFIEILVGELCEAKKIEQQIDDCRKDNQATDIVVQCNLSKNTKQAKCHKFFKFCVYIFDFKTPTTTLTFHGESAD